MPAVAVASPPESWRHSALVLAAAASWGGWSLVLRPTGLPAAVTAPLLFAMMAVWSAPWALRERPPAWSRAVLGLLALNALFDAFIVVTFFAAMDHTTVAIAVLTHYAAPVLVAVAAPWIDRSRIAGATGAAVVAFIGLGLVLEPWHQTDGALMGGGLGLASAVAYAANVFVTRRLAVAIGPARTVCLHSVGAAILLAPLALPDIAAVEARDLVMMAAGTLGLGALAGMAYLHGLARIGATRAAMLTFAEPLVAVTIGSLVWDEPLGALAAAGTLLIVAAGLFVARAAPQADARR
jgi:drug/metabolite transporter (DMT)-like permease